MADTHLNAKLTMDMLGKMLGAVDTTVLTTCTTEGEHQRGEATLDVSAYMGIGKFIHTIKERQNLTVILQETDNGLI